ncbi:MULTISPECIES: type II toxin-antitoxin system PemK/MazF family toxin [unclassified Methylobacterium]|jgi:mRNA interferase MazF|uniref:type II toxin-antitoxin system PemK/MazF family toxin n=1 Tax=unclassified Methylobacterium TaxID=2615210 RepID=UPI0006F47D92|nr:MULTISPECIES: type II toxin-antitoxin system PemK/MazF family toxin [unclassified Methylobacterium]KQO43496.1 hypothetical protein ASF08_09040 [Methylobacterium sp. Leaf85]KQP16401.1 hypothetical protein ASF26_00720 [Methylobacterium sp. Leaf93]TXN26760.1 type II toxin-antitoxin system PemK/MazF family toxin [Methylobacterium sp. WL19]
MPTSDPGGFSPGAVIVVPFPYADRLVEKRRPALVVSGADVARAGFVWVAMITSARNAAMPGDLAIEDLDEAGLVTASVVRPIKIACIEPSRILRRIGSLRADSADLVFTRIRALIGGA